jgi:hypothetical protein
MDLSRPTVRVSHGRVSVLRCRGSRLGKGGSRVYDCAISLLLGPSELSLIEYDDGYVYQVYNEAYSQWQDEGRQMILIPSVRRVHCTTTANGVAWAWHGVAISGRRFPIHLTRRSSQQEL